MSDKLNLSLEEGKSREDGRKFLYLLLLVTTVSALATLIVVIFLHRPGSVTGSGRAEERLEELALKLEKRDLGTEAAETWKEYLRTASPGREQSGRIWYRIGRIYQEEAEYPRALAAYYRAESYRPLENLEREISEGITESLEMMGKFSALETELKERTSISGEVPPGEVIAEIGNRKITDRELREMIEDEVDSALERAAPGLTGEERTRRKEMMIEEAMKPQNRNMWLSRYLAEELIYREAVRDRLHRDPEYLELVEREERSLLVQRYLDIYYSDRIDITEEELREYYSSNRDEFTGSDGSRLSLEDAVQQVYARVRMREENRLQQELMNRLKERYDVVVHRSRLGTAADSVSGVSAE